MQSSNDRCNELSTKESALQTRSPEQGLAEALESNQSDQEGSSGMQLLSRGIEDRANEADRGTVRHDSSL